MKFDKGHTLWLDIWFSNDPAAQTQMFKVRPIVWAQAEDVQDQSWTNTWKFLITFILIVLFVCFIKYSKNKPGMFTLARKMMRITENTFQVWQPKNTQQKMALFLTDNFYIQTKKTLSVMRLTLIELSLREMMVVAVWKPQVWKWMCLKEKQSTRLQSQPSNLEVLWIIHSIK